MKKITVSFLAVGLLAVGSLQAQSLNDGIKDLYAKRYTSARATFEKIASGKPKEAVEANYYLGELLMDQDQLAAAKSFYAQALSANPNAPLLLVGAGKVALKEGNWNEAKQNFEAAITASKGKRNNDPQVLNAVGDAITSVYNTKEKKGDINFAVEKLEEALQIGTKDKELLAKIHTNLADAYRKARPGQDGGIIFDNYSKAIEADKTSAQPHYRLAQLFKTQTGSGDDLYLQHLGNAVATDPKFVPAYEDLYTYYLVRQDIGKAHEYADKIIEHADKDPQNDMYKIQLQWLEKKYDEAISGAKGLLSTFGANTRPTIYKLLAYSYVGKGDTATAKQYIDDYFVKVKPDSIVPKDYKLKADVYSVVAGGEDVVLNSYLDGVKADTVLKDQIDLLKSGTIFFKERKQYAQESRLHEEILKLKTDPNINEYFNAGIAYYFAKEYKKSYDLWTTVEQKFPEEPYGVEWKFNTVSAMDTLTDKAFIDEHLQVDGDKLIEFSEKDLTKFGDQYKRAAVGLFTHFLDGKEYEKALHYIRKLLVTDPENASFIDAEKQLAAAVAQIKAQQSK